MTCPRRLLRAITVLAALLGAAMPGALPALANGIGDLYVGLPAGIAELYLKDEQLLITVDVDKEPTGLAFTNDGASLYAGDGRRLLVRIDIGDMTIADQYTLTSDVPSFAHPKGGILYLAAPAKKALYVLADGESVLAPGPALHGAADLVAADRHDYRVVAAETGKSWVDVVDTVSSTVTKVAVQGGVVALTVASDEGAAFVATSSPDTVSRIDLATAKVTWTAKLAEPPTAVTWAGTESPRLAIVAHGKTLVRASAGGTATWSTLEEEAGALATADEGAYVYVATPSGVTTVTVDKPTAKPPAEIALPAEPAALAPIPKTSSLSKTGGSEPLKGSGNGNGGENGNGGQQGNEESPTKAPATDTEGAGGARFRPAGPDPLVLVGGAAVIALIVVFGLRGVLAKHLDT